MHPPQTSLSSQRDRNVFIMMRFAEHEKLKLIAEVIKRVLSRNGLNGILASEGHYQDDLWQQVQYCMDSSRYGIAVLEQIVDDGFNPNVALELGYMLAKKRSCLILKENSLKALHTDILGRLYSKFDADFTQIAPTVDASVQRWLDDVLGRHEPRPPERLEAPDEIDAVKKRTRRIVDELTALRRKQSPSSTTIRVAASMSSLAIRAECEQDREYAGLIEKERDVLTEMLKEGATLRCMISPEIQIERVKQNLISFGEARKRILPRYDQLSQTIRTHLENPRLQLICVPSLGHHNLLIATPNLMFVGRKRVSVIDGFSVTTVIHDPALVNDEINEFDLAFTETARRLVGKADLGSPKLKDDVLKRLSAAKYAVEQLLEATDPPHA